MQRRTIPAPGRLALPLLGFAFTVLTACNLEDLGEDTAQDGPADLCEGTIDPIGNNGALLTGCTVGTGTITDVSLLRRSFDLPEVGGWEFGQLHLSRDNENDDGLRWIVWVKNVSGEPKRTLSADVTFSNSNGTTLDTDFGSVAGESLVVDDDGTTSINALPDGGTGYISGILLSAQDVWDNASAVTLEVSDYFPSPLTPTPEFIEIEGYRVEYNSVWDTSDVTVTVKNPNAVPITFDSLGAGRLYLLDDLGAALSYTFLSPDGSGDVVVGPGDSVEFETFLFGYEGSGDQLQVVFKFEIDS